MEYWEDEMIREERTDFMILCSSLQLAALGRNCWKDEEMALPYFNLSLAESG